MAMRGLLDKILLNEGMSEAELEYHHLSLEEKRARLPNPLMPADKAFIVETRCFANTLTLDGAAALCAEAIALGIISTPLPFPPLVKGLPSDTHWQEVNQRFISPFIQNMNGTYMLYLSEDEIYAKNISTSKVHTVSHFLNLKETPLLLEHLMAHKRAILNIHGLTPTWITEFNHGLLNEHIDTSNARRDIISEWSWLYRQVADSKDPETIAARKASEEARKAIVESAANKDRNLNKLPFKWESKIKEVLSGLGENSDGSGHRKNTVVHVRLLEDFKSGRFSRKKGDYLCSPKKVANWGDGGTYGNNVTCKTCLQRVEALTKGE